MDNSKVINDDKGNVCEFKQERKNRIMAIVSMILGILSFLFMWTIISPVVLGVISIILGGGIFMQV